MKLYPFQIHSIFLSAFGSLIGPFGGFFASGFKRAFKIKVRNTTLLLCRETIWPKTSCLLLSYYFCHFQLVSKLPKLTRDHGGYFKEI